MESNELKIIQFFLFFFCLLTQIKYWLINQLIIYGHWVVPLCGYIKWTLRNGPTKLDQQKKWSNWLFEPTPPEVQIFSYKEVRAWISIVLLWVLFWNFSAEWHSQFSLIWLEMRWIGCAIQRAANPKRLQWFFWFFFSRNKTSVYMYLKIIETHALKLLSNIMLASAGVYLIKIP